MCGRFAIDISKPVFQKRFTIKQLEIQLSPHYNVSPGMFLPTVIRSQSNQAVLMKWGLIPHWSKDPKVKFSNINARAETINASPAYRLPFQKQRCLIPAIGFYEWARRDDGTKWPYFFTLNDRPYFAFAGIWDSWKDAENKEFLSCAIITCAANSVVADVHPRMPVILNQSNEDIWLRDTHDTHMLATLLKPFDATKMKGYRISPRVNSPHHDDKNLIEPFQHNDSYDMLKAYA